MVPVEDKSPPHNLKLELSLDQSENANQNNVATSTSPSAKIINFERQQHFNHHLNSLKSPPKPKIEQIIAQRPKTLVKPNNDMDAAHLTTESTGNTIDGGCSSGNASILATSSIGVSSDDGKKIKMTKIGNTKNAALKR